MPELQDSDTPCPSEKETGEGELKGTVAELKESVLEALWETAIDGDVWKKWAYDPGDRDSAIIEKVIAHLMEVSITVDNLKAVMKALEGGWAPFALALLKWRHLGNHNYVKSGDFIAPDLELLKEARSLNSFYGFFVKEKAEIILGLPVEECVGYISSQDVCERGLSRKRLEYGW